jgi:alpha-D-ribose 1-methylphosphonate 5-triphosphate synthase subunit PhnG
MPALLHKVYHSTTMHAWLAGVDQCHAAVAAIVAALIWAIGIYQSASSDTLLPGQHTIQKRSTGASNL